MESVSKQNFNAAIKQVKKTVIGVFNMRQKQQSIIWRPKKRTIKMNECYLVHWRQWLDACGSK